MTDRVTDLQSLLSRVEGASGPGDVSPREIFEALGFEIVERKYIGPNLALGFKEYTSWEPRGFRWGISGNYDIAKFTDAALALVKSKLPKWGVDYVQEHPDENCWSAGLYVRRNGREINRSAGHAKTPALAICAALLRALSATEGRDG